MIRTVGTTLLCATAAASSALLCPALFGDRGYVPLLLIAAVLSATLPLLGRWAPVPALAGLVVLPWLTNNPLSALLTGWAHLLSVGLPTDPAGDLLLPPAVLVWTSGFLGSWLTRRRARPLLALLPAVLAFIAMLLLVGEQPGAHPLAAPVLTATCLLLLLRPTPTSAGALLAVTGLVAGLLLAPTLVTGEHRFDPRRFQPGPTIIADTVTPLSTVTRQLKIAPPVDLFHVRIAPEQASRVDRIRIAALDHYDGVLWADSSHYRPVGRRVLDEQPQGGQFEALVDVHGLTGPYLPLLTGTSQVDLPESAMDPLKFGKTNGNLVVSGPRPAELSYTTHGTLPPRQDQLTAGTVVRQVGPPPGIPVDLAAKAREYVPSDNPGYPALSSLAAKLRWAASSTRVDSGQSYADIKQLVSTGNGDGPEPRVSGFAVLARSLGLSARVAVGYRLRSYHQDHFAVTSADAQAWPEVHFAGLGWIPFDVTDPPSPPIDQTVTEMVQPPAGGDGTTSAPQTRPTDLPQGRPDTDPSPMTATGPAGAALLLVLALSTVPAVKAIRRHRRRSRPGPAGQIMGAWLEICDRLTERGLRVTVSMTAHEIATRARPLGITLSEAADAADAAVFARVIPASDAVARVWEHEAQLRKASYQDRIRALFDPRPLLNHLGRRR
ncbi:transglutaminase domain-containing protein [Pseudonocardiaceae bacterium YIM PH 21723]|nr:transglutaminase domain-containing protein [Pseudonocardiaceae bacterium YIM PH 21723]